jgi:hypothetical protein
VKKTIPKGNVYDIDITARRNQNWSQWVLLRSDAHHDNPKCNWELEERHLKEAQEKNAVIIDNGDLFCAMQGKYDRRSSKRDIRPEHMQGDYLDSLVSTACDFYRPYARNIGILGQGNHETAIQKNHETCLTTRLVERINALEGTRIYNGGYTGFIRFRLFDKNGSLYATKNLWRHHGYGGDAPVTKGVIQTNRISVYCPDAHICITGHSHNEWYFPITRLRLGERGRVFHDEQLHIKIPTYKDEYGDGSHGGWAIERGMPPKPVGAVWLRFFYVFATNEFRYEATPAK